MVFRTHVSLGITSSTLALPVLAITNQISQIPEIIIYFIVVIFAAILPDIDHPNSKITNTFLKPIHWIISIFSEHRGFTHNYKGLIIIIAITISIYLYTNHPLYISIGFLIGYISHLIGDSMTVGGLDFFDNGKKVFLRDKENRFYVNSDSETIIFIKLNAIIILEIWTYIAYLYIIKL